MNKNIPVLSIVIGIVIALRWIFDSSDKLLYIVAGINICAIVFVIYTIIERAAGDISKKIESTHVPEQIVQREIKIVFLKIFGWSNFINLILIFLYWKFWCSNLGNDIIAILALGISVLDDEFVKKIVDTYKI